MPTKIEWCINPDGTSGETINPFGWGCYGPCGSQEHPKICGYCFAKKMAKRNLRKCPKCQRFEPHYDHFFDELNKIWDWKKPRLIFVQSMGDALGDWIEEKYIRCLQVTATINALHTFIILTKNPNRLKDFNPWPVNCWVGASATNQKMHNDAVTYLEMVEGAKTFISYEPLLGPIVAEGAYSLHETDWIIIGAQNNPTRLPERKWVEDLEYAAQVARTPIFEKNSLAPLFPRRALQEFPR